MSLDLLDAPVRLTWEVSADGEADMRAIARGIADAGVFFVTLQGRPLLRPELGEIVSRLGDGGCQVLLECGGSAAELAKLADRPLRVQRTLLDATGYLSGDGVAEAALLATVEALRQLGHEATLMLTPLRGNLMYVPDLLDFCRKHAIPRFKLSNASIGASFQAYAPADLLRADDLAAFRRLWAGRTVSDGALPQLEIHDLFLWEIITPGRQQARSEYGGCQAANSLGHIDAAGVVHPCAAWPEPLGRLPDQTLEDLWAGAARLAVRQRIASLPAGCLGCTAAATCLGGCRGLAHHLNRAQGERDLMCPGPR